MKHGGEIYKVAKKLNTPVNELIDFSANINPLNMPESIREALVNAIDYITHYPDAECNALIEKLSEWNQVEKDQILCGNGAADLIYRICYAVKPKTALLAEPTFIEYREALKQTACEIRTFFLQKDYYLTEDLLEEIVPGLDLMFICNPNNPTGLLVKKELLINIIKKGKQTGTIIVLDECFLDFVREKNKYTVKELIDEYDNLIILKSFTKMYALPGIRLGYLLCSNLSLLEKMKRAGQTWSVNSLAQEAGIAALKEEAFIQKTAEYVEKEALYLKKELKKLGFCVFDGKANYIFFEAKGYENLYSQLLKYNIIIRKCETYIGLEAHHYRIAVRTHSDNVKLVQALINIVNNHKESKE